MKYKNLLCIISLGWVLPLSAAGKPNVLFIMSDIVEHDSQHRRSRSIEAANA